MEDGKRELGEFLGINIYISEHTVSVQPLLLKHNYVHAICTQQMYLDFANWYQALRKRLLTLMTLLQLNIEESMQWPTLTWAPTSGGSGRALPTPWTIPKNHNRTPVNWELYNNRSISFQPAEVCSHSQSTGPSQWESCSCLASRNSCRAQVQAASHLPLRLVSY